jgi:hypothetical protein
MAQQARGWTTRRRTALASVLVALAIAGIPAMAAAAKPLSEAVGMPSSFTLPAGAACDFAVRVDVHANNEQYRLWFDQAGNPTRGRLTGRLVLAFTNEESGASVTLQVSGPGHDTFNADGTISTRYTGRGVPLFEGIFLLSVGRHDYEVSGSWDLLEQGPSSGQSHEICDLIA